MFGYVAPDLRCSENLSRTIAMLILIALQECSQKHCAQPALTNHVSISWLRIKRMSCILMKGGEDE
jgi:hypothetical protein